MAMAEGRQDERVRSFLRARILFNNNSSSIECTIKNISPGGAKIELSSELALPDEFDVEVPQKGRTYRARLMWRDINSLGVRFVEKGAAETTQLQTQTMRLEQENRKLKARIAVLTKRLEGLGQDVSATE